MLTPGYLPVDTPPLQIPSRGLVRTATEIIDANAGAQESNAEGLSQPRWVGGFGYVPQSCESAVAIPMFCDPTDGTNDKQPTGNPDVIEYQPYVVLGSDACSAMDQSRDRTDRARQQLLATESYQIARELWRGDLARVGSGAGAWPNRFLTSPTSTDLGTLGAIRALAALEQAAGACLHGQRTTIHASLFTATVWEALDLVSEDQGLLTTAQGSLVIADAGYDGSAPDRAGPDGGPVAPADIADAATAYATGPVYLRRGNIVEIGDRASQINRAVNDWTVFVERPVAALFDGCCLFAVTVDHTSTGVASAA